MRKRLVAYLGTKRVHQQLLGGVVLVVLIRIVLTYGLIIKGYHLRKSNGSAVLSGSLTQDSDATLKGNVEDVGLTDCMNMLENIHAKTYTRNDMDEGNKRLGFISQNVKAKFTKQVR